MLETIKSIICNYIDIDPEEITKDSKLRSDIGLNSFDMVNVAVDLENEYGVSVDSKEFGGIKTVGDLMKYIESIK
ncbi:MAG TPA: acyl carrier protein [Ruminococcaceae bacterium]|nr:acyl carrier protein [Oscillospiraceae bacterium]HAY73338.1 acyl carrier protein [Oscillospiraceae bacterium]